MNTPKRQRLNKNREESSISSRTTIDDIPESILIQIISFLPTTTAAIRTSAVAPQWRHLWHSVPAINFDIKAFYSSRALLPISKAPKVFAEMINQALFQRSQMFPVQKFRLYFDYEDNMSSYVDSWLMFVIRLKVEELDLDFRACDYDYESEEKEDLPRNCYIQAPILSSNYVFHHMILANSSVKVLRLMFCEIKVPLSSTKIYSLREIHLGELYGYTSEELAVLLDSCVNLEVLSLENVEFKEDWKVESKSLKHFTFCGFDVSDMFDHSIEICAPNLESLSLNDAYDGLYSLKESYSLVAAHVEFPGRSWRDFGCWTNIVRSLGGVERLTIENMWCRSKFDREKRIPLGQDDENLAKYIPVEDVFSESFVFHNLKHVELWTGYSEDDIRGLETLLRKCPQLNTMTLINNIYASSNELKNAGCMLIVLQMPRLRSAEMKMFQKTEGELFVVGLLKKYGVCLDKIVAYPKIVDGESGLSYFL